MDDPRGPGPPSRRDLPVRGLHPAEDDEAARQDRLHPVLHLLHLAQHQAGADRVHDRADPRGAREYMRPNFFVNTPDINPITCRPAAGRLPHPRASWPRRCPSVYGIYNGFELCEATPVPGKEEYLDCEKYEIKAWDWDRPGNIQDDIRHAQPHPPREPGALGTRNLEFLNAWNDQILAYGKMTPTRTTPSDRRQSRPAQPPGLPFRGAALGVRPADQACDRCRGSLNGGRFTCTARPSTSGSTRRTAPTRSGG